MRAAKASRKKPGGWERAAAPRGRPRYEDVSRKLEEFRRDHDEIFVALEAMARTRSRRRRLIERMMRKTTYFRAP